MVNQQEHTMKKERKQLFSTWLSQDDTRRLEEIADHKGMTKSGVLREWIANSYRAIGSKSKAGLTK